ncbi:MAG: hypothetical protein IJ309_02020 [Clostridia bacterium]|nr:hypothetical protein [Clostridia bacterium]
MSKYVKRTDGSRDYRISTSYSTLTDRELSLKLRSENWSELSKSQRIEVFQEMENRNASATGRPAAKVVSYNSGEAYGYYTAGNNKIHVNVNDAPDNNSYQMLHTYYHERQHSVQAYSPNSLDPHTASMSKVEDLDKNYNGSFNSSVDLSNRHHYDMLTCEMDSNNVATQGVLDNRELYRTDPEYQKFLTDQHQHFEKVNDTNQMLNYERYERQKEMVNNSSHAIFSSSKITNEEKEQLTSTINQMQSGELTEPVVTQSLNTELDVKSELNAVQLQSKAASGEAGVKDIASESPTSAVQEQSAKAKAQAPSAAYNKGSSFWTNVKVTAAITTYNTQTWLAERAVNNGFQTIQGYCISKGLNAGVGAIATKTMGDVSTGLGSVADFAVSQMNETAIMHQTGLSAQVDTAARAMDLYIASKLPADQLAASYLPTPSEVPQELIDKNTHVLTQEEMSYLGINTSYLTDTQIASPSIDSSYTIAIDNTGTAIYEEGAREPIAKIESINQQSISTAVIASNSASATTQAQDTAPAQTEGQNRVTNNTQDQIIDTPPAKIENSEGADAAKAESNISENVIANDASAKDAVQASEDAKVTLDHGAEGKQPSTGADPAYFDKNAGQAVAPSQDVGYFDKSTEKTFEITADPDYFDKMSFNDARQAQADPSYFDNMAVTTKQEPVQDTAYFDNHKSSPAQYVSDASYFDQGTSQSSAPSTDTQGEDSGAGEDSGSSFDGNDNGQEV